MPFQNQVYQEPAIGVPGDFASNNPYANVLAGEGALVAGNGGANVAAFGWIQADGATVLNGPASTAYVVSGIAVNAAGTGYASGDKFTFTGGSGTVTTVGTNGAVTAVSLGAASPASASPAGTGVATTTTGAGTGLTLNVTASQTASGAPDGFIHRELQALIADIYDEATMTIPQGYMVSLFAAGDFFASSSTAATRGQKVFASTSNGSISTASAGASVSGAIETKFYVASGGAAGETIKISTWDHA